MNKKENLSKLKEIIIDTPPNFVYRFFLFRTACVLQCKIDTSVGRIFKLPGLQKWVLVG
jgi:hypothetical protein